MSHVGQELRKALKDVPRHHHSFLILCEDIVSVGLVSRIYHHGNRRPVSQGFQTS